MILSQYLSFVATWLGIMALIGIALWITGMFRKDSGETVDPKTYAERFEEELTARTPEKPIKKQFRNPFFLSEEEKIETYKNTKKPDED